MTAKTSLEYKFWRHVPGFDPRTCWEWMGTIMIRGGYGQFQHMRNGIRTRYRAHRVSWELHNGPIPKGLLVLHHCDNPPCVNPNHLFLGTPKDNTHDMIRKGRMPRGSARPRTKLTEDIVRDMRSKYANGGILGRELAEEYGVTQWAVFPILRGETWTHVQ